jgi:kumamolisin
MKMISLRLFLSVSLASACSSGPALAAASGLELEEGVVLNPPSNTPRSSDGSARARTFIQAIEPKRGPTVRPNQVLSGLPPLLGTYIETPASLLCAYEYVPQEAGCDPNQVTAKPEGGSKLIAIVDAYDGSTVGSDLAVFSSQFGLPAPNASNFTVINLGAGSGTADGTGWDLEMSLDTQWVHALAPQAQIVLVEAASESLPDLVSAVQYAAGLVQSAGGGQVSMSWGFPELPAEIGYDSYFSASSSVVLYASSGDRWGTYYPCVSPDVVCVGGTSHRRNQQTYALESQWAWDIAGGGTSLFEPLPTYQYGLQGIGQNEYKRVVPDSAAIADPNNGVWVFNSSLLKRGAAWFQVGGTSAAVQITAALDNRSQIFAASSADYLTRLYRLGNRARGDITAFYCGPAYSYAAGAGWDFCSGWGVPQGKGARLLATAAAAGP